MEPPFELDHLRALLQIVEQCGLEELLVEEGGRVVLVRAKPANDSPLTFRFPQVVANLPVPSPPASSAPLPPEWVPVRAPIIGLFYRSAAPDEPSYVEEGDYVKVGQTLGLIEAMKIFNEVVAETEGRVERIVAQNQQLVHSGEVLLWLNPTASPHEGDR